MVPDRREMKVYLLNIDWQWGTENQGVFSTPEKAWEYAEKNFYGRKFNSIQSYREEMFSLEEEEVDPA